MAKTSKRSKKFSAKGGVKARLDRGTITKKGKLKKRSILSSQVGENTDSRCFKQKGNKSLQAIAGKEKEDALSTFQSGKRADHKFFDTNHELNKKKQRSSNAVNEEDEFTSASNLGEVDIESFFRVSAERIDKDDDSVEIDDSNDLSSDEGDADCTSNAEKDHGENDDESTSSDDDNLDVKEAEKQMRKQMEKLHSSDPDFHKFLQENEQSLLNFGGESESDDGGDGGATMRNIDDGAVNGSESLGDNQLFDNKKRDTRRKVVEKKDGNGRKERIRKEGAKDDTKIDVEEADREKRGHVMVTQKLLNSYEISAFESHNLKALRRLVAIYRVACHLSDAQTDTGGKESAEESGENEHVSDKPKKNKYHVDSAVVFDRLMVMSLQRFHEAFGFHLLGSGGSIDDNLQNDTKDESAMVKSGETSHTHGANSSNDENKPIHSKALMKSKRWPFIRPILQTFLKCTLHILSEAKEAELLSFILMKMSKYVQFLTPFFKIAKLFLKSFVSLWSAPVNDVSGYQSVRLQAFLRIRQLALTQPFPFIEDCLKYSYLAYAKSAKFMTSSAESSTLPTLVFMGNCIVEIYSLDMDSSYQHAFVYIRQLALHLRSALQKKTKESFQAVYCWQYVNCLKAWTSVLSAHAGHESELRSLVYPLSEVIFGVARLLPSSRYLPLRCHCVRLLQQLAASSSMFIPTTSLLLDMFDLKEIYMKPKKSSNKSNAQGCRLPIILKFPGKDDVLRTAEQLDACVNEMFLLLNRELDLYKFSVGYPEFTIRICQRLRKFCKETTVGKWRAYGKGCIDVCQRHSEYITKERSKLTEAPKDIQRLEVLKPSDAPDMKTRHAESVSKEAKLQIADEKSEVKTQKISVKKNEAENNSDARSSQTTNNVETGNKWQQLKLKCIVDNSKGDNVLALDEVDAVEEGVNWSDDEGGEKSEDESEEPSN